MPSSSSSSTSDNEKSPGICPLEAIRRYGHKLSVYEQTEIDEYDSIYFCGSESNKRKGGDKGVFLNHGFDDVGGSYLLVQNDHIAYRYQAMKYIGKGSFGQVIKAFDHKHQRYVAIKIVRNHATYSRQAEDEVKILTHLKKQDPEGSMVIQLLGDFVFRRHNCIVFELLSKNLFTLIKENKFEGFDLKFVRKFAYAILKSLVFLHKNNIVHCDLKPENIVLKERNRSGIKIIDFGSACFEDEAKGGIIQTRCFRAPEVILGSKYGLPIDMWSFGCVIAELLTGEILFNGKTDHEQIIPILELMGMPEKEILENATNAALYFHSKGQPRYCDTKQLPDGRKLHGPPGSKDWDTALKGRGDPVFVDFVKKCLEWDPGERSTPQQAMEHVWINSSCG